MGCAQDFARDRVVFARGAPARNIYKVQSGCVRTYVPTGPNRRTDLAFHFPGDYFGLELDGKHSLSAEAISDGVFLVIPRKSVAACATTDLAIANSLIDITSRALKRAQEYRQIHYHSADERVAHFLLDLRKRFKRKEVELTMPRQDIADHLNITIETLSRALTRLHNRSAISLESQRRINVNFNRYQPA